MGSCSSMLGQNGRRTAEILAETLHRAISGGNHDLVKKLLADGAALDTRTDFGDTPLHLARDAEMVQLLVAKGADKGALGAGGNTPLIAAIMWNRDAVAEALLAARADASFRCWHDFTALHLAATRGNAIILGALVRRGIDVNDNVGSLRSALHGAAQKNMAEAIDILFEAGADTEVRDRVLTGSAPLHFAAQHISPEAAIALLKCGAAIGARDKYGETPLHRAAHQAGKRGAVEMVELLLRWGADETASNRNGETPAYVSGGGCSIFGGKKAGDVQRVRQLLENAPAAREAWGRWRRRGLLVASRTRPQMVSLSASTPSTSPRGEWMDLMSRVLGLAEEGMFRTIVGYL